MEKKSVHTIKKGKLSNDLQLIEMLKMCKSGWLELTLTSAPVAEGLCQYWSHRSITRCPRLSTRLGV